MIKLGDRPFPESQWVLVIMSQQQMLFASGDIVGTQTVLQGFTVAVDWLLA